MENRLFDICSSFREAIERVKQEHGFHPKGLMNFFPRACCGCTTTLLRFYLKKVFNIDTIEVCYRYNGDISHAFLMYDNLVIDLTADQFPKENRPPVYVGFKDSFYNSMVQERENDSYYDFEMESMSKFPSETSLIFLHDYKSIVNKLR